MLSRFLPVIISLALAAPAFAAPGTTRENLDEGNPRVPTIPEPMIFDMIRPLGALRGEFEANVLAAVGAGGSVEWAPEIEMAVADGFAVELELPMVDTGVESFKLGLQGTFGTALDGQVVHGVQYLGTIDRQGLWGSSLLYLVGARVGDHWTSMTMVGAKAKDTRRPGRSALLLNQSLFRDVGRRTTAGVEVNHAGGAAGKFLVVPQLHQRIGARTVLQVGAGVEKPRQARANAIGALRLVGEF